MAVPIQDLDAIAQQKQKSEQLAHENVQQPLIAPAAAALTTIAPAMAAAASQATAPQPSSSDTNQQETNFNNAVKQWAQAGIAMEEEKAFVDSLISKLEALLKDHHAEAAWNLMLTQLLPQTQKYQDLKLNQLAATMNIASAAQALISTAQSDANAGTKISTTQAAQLESILKFLHSKLQAGEQQGWIGKSTAENMLASITQLNDMFGKNISPATIQKDIQTWFKNAETGKGTEQVHQLQSGFSELNNTNASHSQDLQTLAQGQTNTITQILNTMASILKADLQQEGMFTRNQKAS
jgi:hypothetical protein